MVRYVVLPCIEEEFWKLGLNFSMTSAFTTIDDKKNNIHIVIDIDLRDGDKEMLVKVEAKPTIDDIRDHIERMEKVRAHRGLRDDNRKYLGAIVGMVMSENEKTFALKSGFYVIEPSGETFAITVPEGIYAPREW